MAEIVGIFGQSGTGKSSSIRNLDPKETFIISCIYNKRLSFKGSKTLYNKENKNYFESNNYKEICKILEYIATQEHIKNVIIDDATYIMVDEFMSRAAEKGYDKFTDLAIHFKKVIDTAQTLPDDKIVFIMGHTDIDELENYKVKTVGKLVDGTWSMTGLFTILLMSHTETSSDGASYYFVTNKMGPYTSKSPMGMFDQLLIDNDLNYVIQKIKEYN